MREKLLAIGVIAPPAAILIFAGLTSFSLDAPRKASGLQAPITVEESVLVGIGLEGDPCVVRVHRAVLPQLEEMGIHEWTEACRSALESEEG